MGKRQIIAVALALVVFGVLIRLLPHLPNATPVTAIALVSSLYLSRRLALLLPITVLTLSDLMLGFYDWKLMASVYGSFALIGCLSWLSRKYRGVFSTVSILLGSATLFFVVTNAAVWAFSPWYEKSLTGLLYSYELGLPFFRQMLMGDLLYSGILLGAFVLRGAIVRQAKFKYTDKYAIS